MKRRFQLDHKVGEGTHGVVYRTNDAERADGRTVAVKRMRRPSRMDGVSLTAYREINLLRSLHHENIVRMLDVVITHDPSSDGESHDEGSSPTPVLNLGE